jgi:hypothetical protein
MSLKSRSITLKSEQSVSYLVRLFVDRSVYRLFPNTIIRIIYLFDITRSEGDIETVIFSKILYTTRRSMAGRTIVKESIVRMGNQKYRCMDHVWMDDQKIVLLCFNSTLIC